VLLLKGYGLKGGDSWIVVHVGEGLGRWGGGGGVRQIQYSGSHHVVSASQTIPCYTRGGTLTI